MRIEGSQGTGSSGGLEVLSRPLGVGRLDSVWF